jgi:hypothetical protein
MVYMVHLLRFVHDRRGGVVMDKYNDYSKRIATHFLCALINGDESGFTPEDKALMTEWLEQFDGPIDVFIDAPEDSEDSEDCQEPHFGRCDVCRLHADVLDCTVRVYGGAK